jgi:type IX secretion system substrate protein
MFCDATSPSYYINLVCEILTVETSEVVLSYENFINSNRFFMKRIFTFLLSLFFLSPGKIFSQDCVVLGCAAAHANQVANVGALTDQTLPFVNGCFPVGSQYRQIVWQFFISNGGNYKQLFTPTNAGDPLNINWVMFDMNNTPPSTNATCADIAANIGSWTTIDCGSLLLPGTPQGPGDVNHATGVGTNAGSHYAIAVIITQSIETSYSFDIGTPTLNLGTSDDPLTAASCDIVLPVKLSSFGARVSNCATSLNWTSEVESGFKNYEVEYSSTGANFKTIATVPAGDITGASQKYSYTDPTPRQGNVYYRLKMVDVDGKFDYSKIVVMKINCNESQLTVYPNPVIDILNVNITTPQDETTTGKLFDSEGRLVYSHTLISGTNTINMRNLPGGIYHLQLIGNTQVQHIKIIK